MGILYTMDKISTDNKILDEINEQASAINAPVKDGYVAVRRGIVERIFGPRISALHCALSYIATHYSISRPTTVVPALL